MRLRRHFGLLYGVLVVLIVSLGVWWVIFMGSEGRSYERYHIQRMELDRRQAEQLIRMVPQVASDPAGLLGGVYPHLRFRRTPSGVEVNLDPAALAAVRREAHRRQRMLLAEGAFFLLLLAAGTVILTVAYRSQRDFERARELLLAGATHELRTPLASLRLYTETLGRPGLTAQAAATVRERMLQDMNRLETMIDQLLALAHEEEWSRSPDQPLDLAEETRAVLADLRGLLESRGAELQVDLPAGHLVHGQRLALSLALRNLLSNAVLHSRGVPRIRVTLSREGGWQRLAVQDQGPGIPRRDRERIFQGVEPQEGRSGLGLYLVQRKAKLLGGRVELETEVGRGSTFTLVLPAYERPPPPPPATPQKEDLGGGSGLQERA
jgi:signal transduction histidine kinase